MYPETAFLASEDSLSDIQGDISTRAYIINKV